MFDSIKLKLARIIVNNKTKHLQLKGNTFNNLLNHSNKFLILMPESESNFHFAIEVLNFLENLDKETVVFAQDYRVTLLPQKYRPSAIGFNPAEINKFKLPAADLEGRFRVLQFDAVIDLEKDENLFNSLLASLVKANIKIGFKKPNSDKYYSLQINNTEDNPEIIYKNLLNCLQMF